MTSKRIPLFKVWMASSAKAEVARVLGSGYIGEGPEVQRFENELGDFMRVEDVVAVNSCTSALTLALHLAGVGPGDEVITTAQTCLATNAPLLHCGATPVFVDVDPASGLIDPGDVKANVTPKTRAIMAVDWAGHPCDYDALRLDVPIIEDAAHAVGTTYDDDHVAVSGGDFVCFSFQAIKHLTTGDGGALCAHGRHLERARLLRWYGLDRARPGFRFSQDIAEVGFKFQSNDIAAAIGRQNLVSLKARIGEHKVNASRLLSLLAGVPRVKLPPQSYESSWWLFTIRVEKPLPFIEEMAELGIECSPVHTRNDAMRAFKAVSRCSASLKGLEEFAAHQVSIPVGWWLSTADIERIAEAVERCA
jgi:dTDP-4-amino-4,6-dideoxygalactose transaminase